MSNKDLFAHEAIGRALHEYAKTNPGEVVRHIKANGVASLSRREALQNHASRRRDSQIAQHRAAA
ncbi:DNA alkylation repair protein [Streptosporangium amethystogenes subsp. fukuiense]|uniref:DNA alkylation repair protein n=1 Tax=Streptosporangium amethystogenes subsp. fukuiense TaxID=698418 RepID=A0ABW2T2W8_9ACTN